MKKHILVLTAYEQHDRIRWQLLNELRKHKIRYEKNQDVSIMTDNAHFYFLCLATYGCQKSRHNFIRFTRKHKQMDKIFTFKPDYEAFLNNSHEKDALLSLLPSGEEIRYISYGNELSILKEHPDLQMKEVYRLYGNHDYVKRIIPQSDFEADKKQKYNLFFSDEESVKAHIRHKLQGEIDYLKGELKQKRALFRKLAPLEDNSQI